MRKLSALLLLLLGSLAAVKAQTPAKALLWEVSGKGLKSPSYVLGTIHMLCPNDFVWTPGMTKALSSAGGVFMELDMDDPETLQAMMKGFSDPAAKPLRDQLSKDDYKRLGQFLKDSTNVNIADVDAADPMTVSMMLMSKLLPCSMPASYEARITTDAVAAKKPIEGLETVEEQLALLKKLGADSGASELMKFVDSFDMFKVQLQDLVGAYRRQDLDSLAAMIAASPILGNQTAAFLSDRNRRWIPKLQKAMAKGPTFVAVGAGHLPGKDGVLELLRKGGYTIRPVTD